MNGVNGVREGEKERGEMERGVGRREARKDQRTEER